MPTNVPLFCSHINRINAEKRMLVNGVMPGASGKPTAWMRTSRRRFRSTRFRLATSSSAFWIESPVNSSPSTYSSETAADTVEERKAENLDAAAAAGTGVARSGAYRNERQLDARLAESHLVSCVNAHALGHPLAIHDGAEVAVIDEHELIAIPNEGAMPT